jgi:sugar/nucleoside kinase (ribokinase family)
MQPNIGGEAVCSAMVLARLGLRCLLDGNWLGDGEKGGWMRDTLRQRGVDISLLTVPAGYPGPVEVVISDHRSRTVFGQYMDLLFTERQWNVPRKEDLARAGLASIDPFFGEESRLAVRHAAELDIPYVMIDCGPDDELARSPLALIVSGEYRQREHPDVGMEELFERYHAQVPGLIVFTAGGDPILYARRGEPVRSFQPRPITPIDTAGAGDSFRSGIIYGLLQGWDDERTVRYASALAALVCLSSPGVMNGPTHEQVLEFMDSKE